MIRFLHPNKKDANIEVIEANSSVGHRSSDDMLKMGRKRSGGVEPESQSIASPTTNSDDALLESLGYKAELKREFSPLELFGVSFSIMSLAPSIASVLTYQLPAGGVGLTWGWFVPCIFILSLGINMSEMASAMPTAGGLYWWTYLFAPDGWKSYLSFLCGYTDSLGLIGGVGSINYGAAQQILSAVNVGTGYQASNGATFGVFLAVTLIELAVCFTPSRYLAKFENFTIVLNFIAVGIICIALPIGMKHKGLELNSGSFVFGDTTNYTSYPYGVTFLLSWMAAIWSVSSQDSCVHMAEEASNAATAVPFGILLSIILCLVLGFVILCVLAAVIDPSLEGMTALMNADSPMATIIERALNKKWSIGIMSLFAFIQVTMGLNALLSCSRQIYAFARDDALPFSKYVKRTTKSHLPIPASIFAVVVSSILGLLILAGSTAATAIFSLANAALYLGWCLPVFVYAFSSQRIQQPGPFYLGHFWSKLNAMIASCYGMLVIFGLAMLPSDIPVTSGSDMNYACVVCGFVWIACSLYWLFSARHWFHGPKITLDKDNDICEVLEAKEWERAEIEPEKRRLEREQSSI